MKEECLSVETENNLNELEDIKEKTRKIIELLETYITPTRQDNSFHSNPNYIIEIKVFISLLKKYILKEPVDKDFN